MRPGRHHGALGRQDRLRGREGQTQRPLRHSARHIRHHLLRVGVCVTHRGKIIQK